MNETDINDWYIELFEDFPCDRKEQLLQREGQIIREIGTLNKVIPGRIKKESDKEYYETNKEQICKKAKEYRVNNKDSITEYEKKRDKDKINERNRNNYLKKKLEKEEAIITIS
jgi:hypothetical protein